MASHPNEKPLLPIGNMAAFGFELQGLAIQTFRNTGDYFFHYESNKAHSRKCV